jgi:hypothetical protein
MGFLLLAVRLCAGAWLAYQASRYLDPYTRTSLLAQNRGAARPAAPSAIRFIALGLLMLVASAILILPVPWPYGPML